MHRDRPVIFNFFFFFFLLTIIISSFFAHTTNEIIPTDKKRETINYFGGIFIPTSQNKYYEFNLILKSSWGVLSCAYFGGLNTSCEELGPQNSNDKGIIQPVSLCVVHSSGKLHHNEGHLSAGPGYVS